MQLSEKYKTPTSPRLILKHFWLDLLKLEEFKKNTIGLDPNWAHFQVLSTLNSKNLELKELDLSMNQTLMLYWEIKILKFQLLMVF